MAEPKKKRSRTRRDRARATKNIAPSALTACTQCGAEILPHIVCPHCGYYRKQAVIA